LIYWLGNIAHLHVTWTITLFGNSLVGRKLDPTPPPNSPVHENRINITVSGGGQERYIYRYMGWRVLYIILYHVRSILDHIRLASPGRLVHLARLEYCSIYIKQRHCRVRSPWAARGHRNSFIRRWLWLWRRYNGNGVITAALHHYTTMTRFSAVTDDFLTRCIHTSQKMLRWI